MLDLKLEEVDAYGRYVIAGEALPGELQDYTGLSDSCY